MQNKNSFNSMQLNWGSQFLITIFNPYYIKKKRNIANWYTMPASSC